MASVPLASSSTLIPVQPSFIYKEHSYAILASPRTLKRKCDHLEEILSTTKKALYNAERRESRAKSKISHVLEKLEKEQLLTSETKQLLKVYEDIPIHLFTKDTVKYTEEQRQFATTLHFYGPKAYAFCRKNLKLPAESTLRKWMSRIDSSPGFSEQVFATLRDRKNSSLGWQYNSCSVMIDGMAIRKHVDWDPKTQKMVGFVDLGTGSADSDVQHEATEALVIMAVGLTGHWKVTLGYFLITGISSIVQAKLIETALIKLGEIGIRGLALVMDGHATNQGMVSQLGGSLQPNNIKSSFPHPFFINEHVYIFFDACHMLKLLRNALQALKEIKIPDIGKARWLNIVHLHELQNKDGLRAGNRLTNAHVDFQNQKMKVRLAAQTLSSSVAKALEFLDVNKFPGFYNTSATRKFIETVDRLFDIFNSRSVIGKGYKKALTCSGLRAVIPFLKESRHMLLNMENINGQKISESHRRMAALGFVINIDSLIHLGDVIFSEASLCHQRYLLTYKLSQDHLELYFSCIRRMGGWNNNPSVKQFSSSYRTLLNRASISAATTGNCTPQDHTDLLHLRPSDDEAEKFSPSHFDHIDTEHDYCIITKLSPFVTNILSYIAGWIVRRLSATIGCGDCLSALVETAGPKSNSLLEIKNNGGLVTPSASVVKVVEHAEKVLRSSADFHHVSNQDQWGNVLEAKVLENLPDNLFCDLSQHFRDTLYGIDNHYTDLVRNICRAFLKLRRFHAISLTNRTLQRSSVRQSLTKTILFKNQ